MKNQINCIYIFCTFRIQWIIILAFILYNCFHLCGYMIVHAEVGIGGMVEAPQNLAKPDEFTNPLVKGICVNYPKDVWAIEKEIQRLEIIMNNNQTDPRESFIIAQEPSNLRLNLLEKDKRDLLTYRDVTSIAILWDDLVFNRLKITNTEAKELLCYLAVLEKEYIYIPEYTNRAVLYDDLYSQIKAFFPSPYGPEAFKYYQDLNSGNQNVLFIEANNTINNLVTLSGKNPLLVEALVIKNQNSSLYSYSIEHPDTIVSPDKIKDMHEILLKSFMNQ